jgi:hypothetical protein
MIRGVEGEGPEGEGANGRRGIGQRKPIGLGGGFGLENLTGFGCGKFRLTGEEVEIEALLTEVGAFRELTKAFLEGFLGLLNFSFPQELMDALGRGPIWSGAGGEEAGGKKKGGNPTHQQSLD